EFRRVLFRSGMFVGFLVGFASGADHDSSNFRWFRERYPDFFYIDQIVVASRRRGGGVGRALYADVQSHAELRHPVLACEVFLDAESDPALLFHGSFGFHEVGQHVMTTADGSPGHRASMQLKEMCSYQWVHDTYGEALPDVPWIAVPRNATTALPQRATGT